MKVTVQYPVDGVDPRLLAKEGMSAVVRRADELGFDAVAFTEHPAPTETWLHSRAGHETLDVLSALAFCAAVTERIRLMTYLLVLPYHNPFLAAKALATVDRLSGGRLTVVAGAGYLREEFEALGIDFGARNHRFDEALDVMRGLWEGVPFDHEGRHFRAAGIIQRPGPIQAAADVPVLIGGNSPLAQRRAARNQGWSPLLVSEEVAASVRMPALTLERLPEAVTQVREFSERGDDLMVQVQTPHAYVLRRGISAMEHAEHLHGLREADVDSFVLKIPATGVDDAVRGLEEYAETHRA